MTFELSIGVLLIGLGCLTLAAGLLGWDQLLWKRQPTKEKFGERTGDIIHFAAYTAVPIVVGLLLVTGWLPRTPAMIHGHKQTDLHTTAYLCPTWSRAWLQYGTKQVSADIGHRHFFEKI